MKIFILLTFFSFEIYSNLGRQYKKAGKVTCYEGYGGIGPVAAQKECLRELNERCRQRIPEIKPGKKYKLGQMELKGVSFINHDGRAEYLDDDLHVTGEAECYFQKIPLQ